jgi:hypothetical protein
VKGRKEPVRLFGCTIRSSVNDNSQTILRTLNGLTRRTRKVISTTASRGKLTFIFSSENDEVNR